MKCRLAILGVTFAAAALGQGQSQAEHVPPDPPQTHVHDMSYREMVEMMGMDDRKRFSMLMLERLEWQEADDGAGPGWEAEAWYGGDYHKAWLEAEGEHASGVTDESRIEGGWERIISPWWSVRAGLRYDAGVGPSRNWLGAGVTGDAPGDIDTEVSVYLGEDGRTAARFEAGRDFLLSQRLVLKPELELSFHGRDDAEKLVGAGVSGLEIGLRLRYEVLREFAPYLGVQWNMSFGDTADLRRAAGEEADEFVAVAGVRAWF